MDNDHIYFEGSWNLKKEKNADNPDLDNNTDDTDFRQAIRRKTNKKKQ